jgi:hypothetical protein
MIQSRMAIEITPQLAQAAERWMQDKVLIDLLTQKREQALEYVGDTTDKDNMLRGQGNYKCLKELLKFIEAAAAQAEVLRRTRVEARPSVPGLPGFPIPGV